MIHLPRCQELAAEAFDTVPREHSIADVVGCGDDDDEVVVVVVEQTKLCALSSRLVVPFAIDSLSCHKLVAVVVASVDGEPSLVVLLLLPLTMTLCPAKEVDEVHSIQSFYRKLFRLPLAMDVPRKFLLHPLLPHCCHRCRCLDPVAIAAHIFWPR